MSTSDPERLVDEDSGPERALLEAWSSMRAPDGARARAIALLGVTTVAATSAMAAGAATGGSAAGAGVAAPAGASTAGAAGAGLAAAPMALATKVLVLAALALAVAGSTVLLWPAERGNATGPVVVAARPHGSATSDRHDVTAPPELQAISVDALPAAPPSARASSVTAAAPPPSSSAVRREGDPDPALAPAPASSALSAQVVELEAIRAALTAHEHDLALSALDRFGAHHPGSPLAEEAAALRFDVQMARGDRAAAADAARRFLTRYPASPYAVRIRRASADLP